MERVGQQLGNYRLIRLLGRGAFSDVYLGEHRYLNTSVAIKILRTRIDESTLANFLAEARHVSSLAHPHIISVFDFGLEANVPFLVMDYAPFGNLRQLYPRGTIVPLPTVISHVKALASGLQHAHDQHLVHRDLKPENVLLGARHEVLLSDFGLALATSETEHLQRKERFGTVAYMAPEHILGQPCPTSDQYALAVMIYEWLSGRLPFEGPADQLVDQHLHAAPPSLCTKNAGIPLEVEKIIFAGLSKKPATRFVDVLSFARALEAAYEDTLPSHGIPGLPLASPSGVSPTLHGPNVRFQNIPVPLTSLIGREQELQGARDLLMNPEVRLVTLTGPGGIGKTHLALVLGNDLLETFAHGVCFVPLDSVTDSELIIPAIAHALGLQERGYYNQFDYLKTVLRDKQVLLLLDNFEQIRSAAPLLSELLSSCPQLKLLVTSRSLLRVWGEYEITIPALEVPGLQHLPGREVLQQVASVALFVQRSQAILPGFQLSEENAHDIAEICNRLEGVPLAIELSAARSRLLPPHLLLSRLESGLQMLTGGRLDAPERQQTLHNTVSWDYDLLSPDEQTLLQRLSIFVRGCSLQAAETISHSLGGLAISVLDGVASLIDKSLLRRSAQDGDDLRLFLYGMIREYGLELLAANGEMEQARDAHATYYLAFAEGTGPALFGLQQEGSQKPIECEYGNLREALLWLLERHRVEEALRLLVALQWFWLSGTHGSEGHMFLERALEAASESGEPVPSPLRSKALRVAASLASTQDDPESSRQTTDHLTSSRASRHLQGERGSMAMHKNQPDVPPTRTTEPLFPLAQEDLTPREVEVLRLLARGMSNNQIAEQLVLSPHTVNVHNQSIFGKLGVNSRSGATRYALEHQLA